MRRRAVSRTLVALVATFVLVAATSAGARPGGGSSFSGGGRGGGGGFSGTGGGFSGGGFSGAGRGTTVSGQPMGPGGLLVLLVVLGVSIGAAVLLKKFNASMPSAARGGGGFGPEPDGPPPNLRLVLERLRTYDSDFSVVIFEDFLYALYAEAHHARGAGQLARLSAYVAPGAQAQLGALGAGEVRDVVIGAMRFASVNGVDGAPRVTVGVVFETNYTQAGPNGPQSYYAEERWMLERSRDARSRSPDRARVFGCPSCGAPLDVVIAGTCNHCRQAVASGDFDWMVSAVETLERKPRGPMLTSTVDEEGTDLPTVRAANVDQAYAALTAKDPQFDWNAFTARVALIFGEFQIAWSGRDLMKMRPFLSERLFAQQVYWIEAYKKQGLRNMTDGAKIEGLEIARVSGDKYFDAIVVRLRATSQDYTVDDKNHVVSGKKGKERRYTEYWTLIRGAGRSAKPRTDLGCPNCGAPLEINMAGDCKYCRAKVTTGEFDWVLSRIEQDEVYVG